MIKEPVKARLSRRRRSTDCSDGSIEFPPAPRGAERFGAWFDAASADQACRFFPAHIRYTEGEFAGRPFVLAPWERRIVRTVFGWKRGDDGTRLVRRVYIEIPKKNGKSEFGAALALLILLFDNEMRGQVYAVANDEDQAKIVFGKAATMVELSPGLRQLIEPFKTSLYCSALMAAFKPLSKAVGTKHGMSTSGAIYDEIHAAPDGALADVVHKNAAARRQPLEFYLTTAGVEGWGFGWEMHEAALAILSGEVIDPTFLAVVFAAGPDDDWTDEAVWAKANPGLGVSPKIDFLRTECAAARRSPRLENEFKRFHLNQWVGQVERWIPGPAWAACAGAVPWAELPGALEGAAAIGGLDLSQTTDLTAFVLVFEPQEATTELARRAAREDGRAWFIVPRFFMPEAALDKPGRSEIERARLKQWIKAGAIVATPGNVIDYGFVEEDVFAQARRYRIAELPLDRYNASYLATRLQIEGVPLVEFGQGYASMSPPAKEFERLVLGGAIRHGGHPVMTWMVDNVTVATDTSPARNIKPVKGKTGAPIDGVVGAVMAIGRLMARPPPVDLNALILKRGGLLTVTM